MTEEKTPNPRVSTWIPWLVVVPFILITVVLVIGQADFKAAESISGTFPLPKGVKTVKIITDVGNVEVMMGPAGQVTFEGTTLRATGSQEHLDRATEVPFTIETAPSDDPSVFVVRVTPMPDGFLRLPPRKDDENDQLSPRLLRQMDVRFKVPVDLAVAFEASQGSIRIDTRQAATSAAVEKGNMMLQHIVGLLTVRNGDGDTMVDQHRGPLDVQGNGKIRITMSDLNGRVDVITDKGELDFLLPAHSSAALDAQSLTGNVRNSFGFSTESKAGGSTMTGKLGDGTHPVRLIARKGTLTLTATKKPR